MPEITQPLVSCIMPTCNRRGFVRQALHYFLRQDYANRELIILDDGTDPVEDLVSGLTCVRYIRLQEKCLLGTKRNLACEEARGEIIAHWDDDDWMSPGRLTYQVDALLGEQAEVCGLDRIYYFDPPNGRSWQYVYDATMGQPWVAGGTICYTKDCWKAHPFFAVNSEEDNRFVWATPTQGLLVLTDMSFYVGLIHPGNVSPKQTSQSHNWQPLELGTVRALIGGDWGFYKSLGLSS